MHNSVIILMLLAVVLAPFLGLLYSVVVTWFGAEASPVNVGERPAKPAK